LADIFQNTIKVGQHIIVPKPDDAISVTCKFDGASIILRDPFAMLTTVEFDDQFTCWTSKVGEAPSDRMLSMLSAKLPGHKVLAQSSPKYLFDIRGLFSEVARDLCSGLQGHHKPHLTLPLRPNGAERGR